jgi:inhibitor of growth protein 3
MNGSLRPHSNEQGLAKSIRESYERAQSLQDEKIQLVAKACSLLDRYVRRLDIKIRDLQAEGSLPLDPSMPTLLRQSPGNLVPHVDSSGRSTGASTPLQPLSTNALAGGGGPSIAQVAALNRLAASGNIVPRAAVGNSVAAQIQHAALHSAAAQHHLQSSVNAGTPRMQRELSANGPDSKRRRLNASLGPLPTPILTNTTRHSSLGPGTPRAGTPGGSRAGSVGPSGRPSLTKKTSILKKAAPLAQQLARGVNGLPGTKKIGGSVRTSKKGGSRRGQLLAGSRASPSTTTGSGTEEDSDDAGESVYSASNSVHGGGAGGAEGNARRPHAQHHPPGHGVDANGDVDMDEGSDDTKYCYCHDVSHGDMIACDNADCKIQWFHWTCAGITSEPQGEWLCRDCRKLPRDKIRKS